jgi:archaellum biogenesis protein FlaJ (TadC family)
MFKNEKQQLRIMGVMFESVHEIVGQYHTGYSTAMSHILSNIKQKHEMSDYVFNV